MMARETNRYKIIRVVIFLVVDVVDFEVMNLTLLAL